MEIFTSFLATSGTLVSALLASGSLWAFFRSQYLKGWGSRRHWRKKFNHLANWVTDDYIAELLGAPVMIDQGAEPNSVNRIYLTPHAWVVTRSVDGKVQGWSVTITDTKFWWSIEAPTFWQLNSRLGRATFASLDTKPSGSFEARGARSYLYAESVYWGNPGAHQTYVFMHNNAGTGRLQPSRDVYVKKTGAFAGGGVAGVAQVANAETRANTTVNTLMVLSPSMSIRDGDFPVWPTVNRDQVRMVYSEAKARRERYVRRARWRRIIGTRGFRRNDLPSVATPPVERDEDDAQAVESASEP
ncbi:ETEC_3214 domain-containing protein [Arthrobacter sp. NA-172]|uniref:ETEC_3214 domain-containing protein n=1 Tax=Arthrobacter sp. NA-172 TaxID=3367524 RepID=UPI00375450ED